MHALRCCLISLLLTTSAAQAATDCALGEQYVALAHDRIGAGANEEAVGFLNHAIEVCPNYDAFESLGEFQAQSPEEADQKEAVKAFVAANDLAPTDQARAKTQFEYAKLLARNDEQQRAYPLAENAHVLDRDNLQISALAKRLREEISHPTQAQLVRGFMQNALYMPLHLAPGPAASAMKQPRSDEKGAGGSGNGSASGGANSAQTAVMSSPSILMPINFNTASTDVDQRTWPNIATLAHVMAKPQFVGHRFVFVGHADMRGDDQYNMALSRQRAAAMYRDVVLVEPSLQGRIDVDGHGSHEPLDPGITEEALRTNRRLQVIIK